MGAAPVCQSAHQGFLGSQVLADRGPGQADWDWTPVWRCPLDPPALLGSHLELRETAKHTEKRKRKISLGKSCMC